MRTVFVMILCSVMILAACTPFTDVSGKPVSIHFEEDFGLVGERVVPVMTAAGQMMKAEVKGSIYGSGEQISLFGLCLDVDQNPIDGGAVATLNAWYPNGTSMFTGVVMQEMQSGYYVYIAPMDAVQGTYLTELTCVANVSGETAKAWGEWQNPMWVTVITQTNTSVGDIQTTLLQMNGSLVDLQDMIVSINGTVVNMTFPPSSNDTANLTEILRILNEQLVCGGTAMSIIISFDNSSISVPCTSLGQAILDMRSAMDIQFAYIEGLLLNNTQLADLLSNLSIQMSGGFNTTWQMINSTNVLIGETYTNLTQQIVYVGNVANGSVDRNDSYLAQMLQLLVSSTGAPITHVLTVTEYADTPTYYKNWDVDVEVRNEYNVSVGYPVISCFINTTNSPATVNQLMTPVSSTGNPHVPNTNPSFYWIEKIKVRPSFDWTTWCVYN
jgi:hypothetical protein